MAFAILAIFALLTGVSSDVHKNEIIKDINNSRAPRSFDTDMLSGCLYDGRWYASGASVITRESCLRCVCLRTALSCSRRACAPLPDPPPKRCHVRHRRGSCCPELHCPDVVINMEHEASARSERDDFFDFAAPPSSGKACVEGGTVYAAGSAMTSNVACEQCFCLKGIRKCVRPNCLPPPPHCVPRPTAGACCPQRYYCEHDNRPIMENSYDCEVNGRRVQEGERVISGTNCTTCFCLKGAVRCQALGCAPALHGCEPVLRPGECCPHQYKCGHNSLTRGVQPLKADKVRYNSLVSTRMDDRALHTKNMSKLFEITTKKILNEIYTVKNMPIVLATKNDVGSTTKVKRKTDENSLNLKEKADNETVSTNVTTSAQDLITPKLITVETTELSTETTTAQPEGTVKIVINGTINCTAELSSTSLPLNVTNDTDRIQMEALPRIPIVNGIEAQTYSPNDIITDRSVNGDFDENETFTINVTSSLNANPLKAAKPIIATTSKIPAPVDLINNSNSSKKTKGDYDYDYTEPTLPPSLPNLKIIPFVAADAVVDDESPKEALTYPILEREDKFPVYYPPDTKETFTRREDLYHPTQYPIFLSKKDPVYTHDLGQASNRYPMQNEPVHEYTVSTSLGSHKNEPKTVTKSPQSSSTFELDTPAINLFSPPVETEGGFIPKGPGIIDEYYAVYPSTPPGPVVPHLTTSMQLDMTKGECVLDSGQNIPDGESATIGCSECICMWGRLNCAPKICRAPAGCELRTPTTDSRDQCCGDIVCDKENADNLTKNVSVTEKSNINDRNKEEAHKNGTIPILVLNKDATESPFLPPSTTNKIQLNTTKNKDVVVVSEKPKSNIDNRIEVSTGNNDTSLNIPVANTTTEQPIISTKEPMSSSTPNMKEMNYTSAEYEDDDDEGFSFGSVLKLLLSDSYDSTTKSSNKIPTSVTPSTKTPSPTTTTIKRPSTTINPFKPLPSLPYIQPNFYPATVNRIDHLVLGEATAIKKTTSRPITTKTTTLSTEKPTERPEVDLAFNSGPRPPNLGGTGLPVGAELLKLAGCNIYGRMYRVGRIIAELSTECQECWCTELGVQCNPLGC